MNTFFDPAMTRRSLLAASGLSIGGLALAGCVAPTSTAPSDGSAAPTSALKPDGTEAGGEITILDDNTNLVFKDGLI